MDTTPEHLLNRLDAIARVLRERGDALALIGLGSVGGELERLDAHSDLDFFVIVERGRQARYIDRLDWLAAAHPIAWSFRNTADGHKALMADGVFCEFAVFEPMQLEGIPYAPGRIVWARADADPSWAVPRHVLPAPALPDEAWIVGEALSCLLVGLQRWHRGERLSAARFVQGHALDRLIEFDALRQAPPPDAPRADPFNRERRLEARQPALAAELPLLAPGYQHTPAAALAVLAALRRRGADLNDAVVSAIHRLAQPAPP
jgi:hypothetical protein